MKEGFDEVEVYGQNKLITKKKEGKRPSVVEELFGRKCIATLFSGQLRINTEEIIERGDKKNSKRGSDIASYRTGNAIEITKANDKKDTSQGAQSF